MSQTLVQELRNSDIDWLIANGIKRKIDTDRLLIKAGQQITSFYLLISGSLTISSVFRQETSCYAGGGMPTQVYLGFGYISQEFQ